MKQTGELYIFKIPLKLLGTLSFQALDFSRMSGGRKSRYSTEYKNRSNTRERSLTLN